MIRSTLPNIGDIVSSQRFQYGFERPDDRRLQVGCLPGAAEDVDPNRANARFLVVHISATDEATQGDPFREVTALVLDQGELRDEIVFETMAPTDARIEAGDIDVRGHYDTAPVLANSVLVVKAKSKKDAALIGQSVLGFVPTGEPERAEGGSWTIEGFSFRPVIDDRVVGQSDLLVANL